MIEKQEVKRQVLKKRAEQTKADSDNDINWDEDEDDLETVEEIPGILNNPLRTMSELLLCSSTCKD